MEWLNTLIKKLPTFKGIADFFYVATHWNNISTEREAEREGYRRQIKEREEWLTAHKENLKTIHALEKERMDGEFQKKLDAAAATTARATAEAMTVLYAEEIKTIVAATRQLVDLYDEAATRLAIFYHFEPLRWELERTHLKPDLKTLVESIMARLPPLPPPVSQWEQRLSDMRLSDVLGPLAGPTSKKP